MSNDSYEYKQGLERGKAGKSDAQVLSGLSDLFDSSEDRSARQRGFEAGSAAKATADALANRASSYSGGSTSSSYSSSSDIDQGLGILLVANPIISLFGGLSVYLLAALATHFGRTAAAAAVKALGGSRPMMQLVLTADIWTIALPFGAIAFVWLLARGTIKWFKDSRNREEFWFAIGFIGLIIAVFGLYRGWVFLKVYTAN